MKPTLFFSMPLGRSVLPDRCGCSSMLALPVGVMEPSSPDKLGEPLVAVNGVPGSLPAFLASLASGAGLVTSGSRVLL